MSDAEVNRWEDEGGMTMPEGWQEENNDHYPVKRLEGATGWWIECACGKLWPHRIETKEERHDD